MDLRFQQHLALAAMVKNADALSMWWETAETTRKELVLKLLPWVAAYDIQTEIKDMTEQYRKTFGDPGDPAFQEEMQRLIAHWHGGEHGGRSPTS